MCPSPAVLLFTLGWQIGSSPSPYQPLYIISQSTTKPRVGLSLGYYRAVDDGIRSIELGVNGVWAELVCQDNVNRSMTSMHVCLYFPGCVCVSRQVITVLRSF